MPIAHSTYRNGAGAQIETRNNLAEITHARVIRSRSTSRRRGHGVRAGQHEPGGGEAQREDRDVPGRRRLDRDRGDARRHAAGQEQQPLGGLSAPWRL